MRSRVPNRHPHTTTTDASYPLPKSRAPQRGRPEGLTARGRRIYCYDVPMRRGPHVYLLRATDGVLWKIGASRRPRGRLREVVNAQRAATLVHVIPSVDMFALEAWLHRRYAAVRDQGEWFRLTPVQVSELCAWSTDPRLPSKAASTPVAPYDPMDVIRAEVAERHARLLARLGA